MTGVIQKGHVTSRSLRGDRRQKDSVRARQPERDLARPCGSEGGGRGHQPKNAAAGKQTVPWSLGTHRPCPTLILAP